MVKPSTSATSHIHLIIESSILARARLLAPSQSHKFGNFDASRVEGAPEDIGIGIVYNTFKAHIVLDPTQIGGGCITCGWKLPQRPNGSPFGILLSIRTSHGVQAKVWVIPANHVYSHVDTSMWLCKSSAILITTMEVILPVHLH